MFGCLLLIICISAVSSIRAQTSAFTYQGKLNDGGNPANTAYDMRFSLFDAVSAGNQIGSTITNAAVQVTGGIFTVQVDFGAAALPGTDRWIEIGIRLAGSPNGFTLLSPRQPLTSAPYSVKSLSAENATNATNAANASNATNATTANNALSLGGVAAGQYVLTGDARLSDARNPLPGSPNYVQPNDSRLTDARNPLPNSGNYVQNTNAPQSSSNFNISGNGTAGGTLSGNIVSATADYRIGINRVLSATGQENIFVGAGSGAANAGTFNSFVGSIAGITNTSGSFNSFFGRLAGGDNTTGSYNAFFGYNTGLFNTTGTFNSFFGEASGGSGQTGSNNTTIGAHAGLGGPNLDHGTALGANSVVSTSNTIVLGRANGSDTVSIPGKVIVGALGTGGSTALCRTFLINEIATCSSSLRYKKDVTRFSGGLDVVARLRPISFTWKDHPERDVGLAAEEVATVEPLLVTHNAKGEIEGVKYDHLNVVIINAIKQQQKIIESQQRQIDALKKLTCLHHKKALTCKDKK